jgi:hypothetical protein
MRIPLESYQNIRNKQGFLILPKEFTCRDGHFVQLKRIDNLAIYQRNKHFEVIYVQSNEPFEITKGVFTEKKEGWPADTTWGVRGWTELTLEGAEKKFEELLNPVVIAPKIIDSSIPKRGRGRPRKQK